MCRIAGKTRSFVSLAAVVFTVALTASSPVAATATLSASVQMQELGLQKRGEGRMSVFGISLYNASLWTETAAGAPDPTTEPVLLQIDYERNIKRERIVNITRKEWSRLNVAGKQQRQVWLEQLERLLPDIYRGDQLSSLILPGEETRFYFGGTEIGRIQDPAFGEAFLAIWLDPRTRAEQLRRELLAEAEPASAPALSSTLARTAN